MRIFSLTDRVSSDEFPFHAIHSTKPKILKLGFLIYDKIWDLICLIVFAIRLICILAIVYESEIILVM